ncbi:MAG: PD-(D/E)XK nuclease family transposase [Coriobacteriia bacterium]|nr:PD-(D/E)XK nuclease family transposase [Coriobacteriia bacterium]
MTQARSNTPTSMGNESPKQIDPLFNDAFVRVFGREESKPLTRNFVNAILREIGVDEVGDIDEIHAEYTDIGEIIGCKTSRFDVLIAADGKRKLVDLEAQRQPSDIGNRALLYGARIMSTYTDMGTSYADLPHVIVITLLDTKSEFEDGEIISTATLKWQVGGEFVEATDRLRFILVDLVKARKRYNRPEAIDRGDEMAAWLYALTNGYRRREELNRVMEAFPSLEEFAKQYDRAVSDPALIRAYQAAADYWREEESRERWLAEQERKAVERGLQQGIEQNGASNGA